MNALRDKKAGQGNKRYSILSEGQVLVDPLSDTFAYVKVKTLSNILVKVKAEALVAGLANTLAEVKVQTLSNSLVKVDARKVQSWSTRLRHFAF